MSNYLKRGLSGSIATFLTTILAAFSGYGTRAFLAHILDVDSFGLFYSVFTFVMFFKLFADLGFGQALVRYVSHHIAEDRKELIHTITHHVITIKILLAVCISALLILLSHLLSKYYFKIENSAIVLVILALVLIVNNLDEYYLFLFQAFQKITTRGLLYASNKLFFLLACIILYLVGFEKDTLLPTVAYGAGSLLSVLLFSPAAFTLIWPIKFTFEKTVFRKLALFAAPNMISSFAGLIIGYVDVIMLTYLVPIKEVGIYNSVLPTALLVSYFSMAVTTVLFPMASELHTKGKSAVLSKGTTTVYGYVLAAALPICAIFFFFPGIILKTMFGAEFGAGAMALKILAVGVAFLCLSKINFSLLNGLGSPKSISHATLISAGINVVLNLILIPLFGITGAALTTSISYLAMFLVSYCNLRKNISFKFGLLWLLIAVSALSIPIFLLKPFLPVLGLALGLVAFALVIVWGKVVDIKILYNFVKNLRKQ
ncbi:flippase [Candidatus Woesearchaeota archaeon]|nr:flippase [Candidatus Woesearchaeota archaeon]